MCHAQVYQLPLSGSSRFADLLQALDTQKAALGLTHYAMSMPSLEEVFLKCTAKLHEQQQPVQQPAAPAPAATAPAAPPSDSVCVVRVSPPRAGGSPAEKTLERDAEQAEAGSSASSTESVIIQDAAERIASSAASSASVQSPGPEAEGEGAWQRQGSMSRDDSAKALNKVGTQQQGVSRQEPGSGAPSSSTSSRRGSGEEQREQSRAEPRGLRQQGGSAEEPSFQDVPLHEAQKRLPSRQRPHRHRRWSVAFVQMLRKRAIIASAQLIVPVREQW